MRNRFLIWASLVGLSVIGACSPAATTQPEIGSDSPAAVENPRDLSGLWEGQGFRAIDISQNLLPGEEISLTPYGAERYRANNYAKSPANTCMPYGPTRAMHSADPQEWLQSADRFVILLEQQSHYRLIYTDGRPQAADAQDYPSWMGHSIGRWEGDTLVIDTIGIDERSWLDSAGFEHSEELHVIERYEKVDEDTMKLTFTVEDPVFFTKPFTYSNEKVRSDPSAVPRILPQICNENEIDASHIEPLPPGHVNAPTFPD